jgi:hypothetical protein
MVETMVGGTVVAVDMVEVADTVVVEGTVVAAGMVEVMVEDPVDLAILEVDMVSQWLAPQKQLYMYMFLNKACVLICHGLA